ncbi:bucentaur or craniofacial development-domain-containing protein [Aspergillus granulosus]|uniref:SWR1-complex protein 5 n=1 Tax=Aspergillus granulosus TaxID=176169 RepID=A0ABR4H1H4_9EURO
MADPDLDLDDEPYDSAEDEDFTLDQAANDDDAELSSSDEETAAEPTAKRRKTKKDTKDSVALETEELDSGDEATIRKVKEKKRGGTKSSDGEDDVDFDEDEEGGEGGFVRTRAMKMRIQEERKPLAKIDGATIDVDALWAQMNAADSNLGLAPSQAVQNNEASATNGQKTEDAEMRDQENDTPATQEKRPHTQQLDEMIKIKRTYEFAGEMITEEKLVPRDSAEAKLFLSSEEDGEVTTATGDDMANAGNTVKLRRPLRKISRFDPNPTGAIKKSWEKQPVTEAGQEENARGPKINTVEKSRLDWAAYVDRAGISDELRVHSKAKEGFLGRMDFLDRVDAKREEERRNARLKGV